MASFPGLPSMTNSLTISTGQVTTVDLVLGFSVSITNQPQDQAVLVGLSPAFSVGAAGTGPFGYQWCYNGQGIPGATNGAFAVTNAAYTNSGLYSVVVWNFFGPAVGSNALLTVIPVGAWGDNGDGQTAPPPSLTNAVAVAGGMWHSLALRGDGTLLSPGARITPANAMCLPG